MMGVEQIAASLNPVLILDYDGTLAPFVVERDKAVPYDGVIERIEAIAEAGKTRLIIMSGRALADLRPLLKLRKRVELWGGHGAERELPDGTKSESAISAEALAGLEEARSICSQMLPSEAYEVKPTSIAVHTRGGGQELVEEEIVPAFNEIAFNTPLQLHRFDGGVELRPEGINKGTAVNTLLEEAGDALVAYLGDDLTDEDAFEALGDRGLKVLVRAESRPTKADMRITPPEELLNFLDNWIYYERH